MTGVDFASWLTAQRDAEDSDGWPLRPPTRAVVDELIAAGGVPADQPMIAGREPQISAAAVCAAMAGCPPMLFPTALAALRLVLDRPLETLGVADPWSIGSRATVPVHPVTVLSAAVADEHDLWTGYGALSSPIPGGVGAVGRTVALFLRRHVPAYRNNVPVFGHPGRAAYALGCRASLSGADPRHIETYRVACAAVSGPRALYLGGAAGQVPRLARIIADGLLTAVGPTRAESRAALIVVNPTTAGDLATAEVTDLQAAVAAAAALIVSGGDEIIAALDLLPVVAGGASQTWIAVAVGPPDSGWVFA
jgi:hypothetical protein